MARNPQAKKSLREEEDFFATHDPCRWDYDRPTKDSQVLPRLADVDYGDWDRHGMHRTFA